MKKTQKKLIHYCFFLIGMMISISICGMDLVYTSTFGSLKLPASRSVGEESITDVVQPQANISKSKKN